MAEWPQVLDCVLRRIARAGAYGGGSPWSTSFGTRASTMLYAINVDPDHWGRGLGRALLAAVTRGLAGIGYHTAVLWVATRNERARYLYESEGWTVDGPARDAEFLGVTVNEVRYRKRLDS